MHDFRQSTEFAFRKLVRASIQKHAPFPPNHRNILVALVDLWFHHRNGPLGCIHPSREQLVKTANCKRETVKRALGVFREIGILIVVSDMKGGRKKATRYKVDIEAVLLTIAREDLIDAYRQIAGATLIELKSGLLFPTSETPKKRGSDWASVTNTFHSSKAEEDLGQGLNSGWESQY
jgi:hypothetical protein